MIINIFFSLINWHLLSVFSQMKYLQDTRHVLFSLKTLQLNFIEWKYWNMLLTFEIPFTTIIWTLLKFFLPFCFDNTYITQLKITKKTWYEKHSDDVISNYYILCFFFQYLINRCYWFSFQTNEMNKVWRPLKTCFSVSPLKVRERPFWSERED